VSPGAEQVRSRFQATLPMCRPTQSGEAKLGHRQYLATRWRSGKQLVPRFVFGTRLVLLCIPLAVGSWQAGSPTEFLELKSRRRRASAGLHSDVVPAENDREPHVGRPWSRWAGHLPLWEYCISCCERCEQWLSNCPLWRLAIVAVLLGAALPLAAGGHARMEKPAGEPQLVAPCLRLEKDPVNPRKWIYVEVDPLDAPSEPDTPVLGPVRPVEQQRRAQRRTPALQLAPSRPTPRGGLTTG